PVADSSARVSPFLMVSSAGSLGPRVLIRIAAIGWRAATAISAAPAGVARASAPAIATAAETRIRVPSPRTRPLARSAPVGVARISGGDPNLPRLQRQHPDRA